MKKTKVIQFGVQISYVRNQEEGAQPAIMVVNPNGMVLAVVNTFGAVADVLSDLANSVEEKSVVNTDN